MPRDLFAAPTNDGPTPRAGRLIPISIALHALVAAAVIVAPLMAVGELPPVRDRLPIVLVTSPPLPRVEAVPAPPRPGPARPAVTRLPGPDRPPVNITTPDGFHPESDVDTGVPEWLPRGGGSFGIGDLPALGRGEGGDGVQAAAPAGPVRPGGDIRRPRKVTHVVPEYPEIARRARVQGLVVIDAIIGPDGYVRQVTVRRSDSPLLESAALTAVRQWVYSPTRLNDVPVAVVMSVEVRFTLGH